MKPDQAKTVGEVIGQNLQGEWMHTYKAINAVPDAKKDYKPADNSRTAWDLAHHIAICDVGFLNAVAANSFSVFPAKCDAKNIPDLASWYKTEMPKALEKVLALDGNHLCQTVEAFGMFADLAVLSADLFTVPVADVEGIRSVMTMFGGKVVFETGVVH